MNGKGYIDDKKHRTDTTSKGRIYGEGSGGAHPPPRDDLRFSNTTSIL